MTKYLGFYKLLGYRPMTLRPRKQPKTTPVGFNLKIPEQFHSLDEARNSLEYLTNGFVKFLNDTTKDQILEKDEIERRRKFWFGQLEKWDSAFEAFVLEPFTQLNPKSQQAAWALKINQRLGIMYMRHQKPTVLTNDTIWDLYPKEGEDIVRFAENLLALDDVIRGPPGKRKVAFVLDMSLVGPLYAVAHKYRDPILRRRAIALLKKADRQEGIWNSALAAKVAERIVAAEESAIGNVTSFRDIPNWARIHTLQLRFNQQERRGYFSYLRAKSQDQQFHEAFDEVIYW